MNRKQFIVSQDATCQNWTWSWSFINKKTKVIIFGAWDVNTNENTSLILSEDWQISKKGRKQPAYEQSREHIRLVEEEGYQLKTFPIKYSNVNEDEDGVGPAKIESFDPVLTTKILMKIENNWYAFDNLFDNFLPEEVDTPQEYIEGASKLVSVNTYERNLEARAKCIEFHGYKCAVCSFDFEKFYGPIGKDYIHVHHIMPLSEIKKEYKLNPLTELIPVCANCHAIIHRTRRTLTIEQLRYHLALGEKNT